MFRGFERARKGGIAEGEELTSQDCHSWEEGLVELSVGFSYFPVLLCETDVWGR